VLQFAVLRLALKKPVQNDMNAESRPNRADCNLLSLRFIPLILGFEQSLGHIWVKIFHAVFFCMYFEKPR
jgi:hypothetical protein